MCILFISNGIFPKPSCSLIGTNSDLTTKMFPFIRKAVCPAETGRSVVESEMSILSQSALVLFGHSKLNPCFSFVHVFYFFAEDVLISLPRTADVGSKQSPLPAHFLTSFHSTVKKAMRLSLLKLTIISVSPPLARGYLLFSFLWVWMGGAFLGSDFCLSAPQNLKSPISILRL